MKNKQKTYSGILGVIITVLLYFSFEDIIFKNLMILILALALIYAMILIDKNSK